jgi:hypothetical protein
VITSSSSSIKKEKYTCLHHGDNSETTERQSLNVVRAGRRTGGQLAVKHVYLGVGGVSRHTFQGAQLILIYLDFLILTPACLHDKFYQNFIFHSAGSSVADPDPFDTDTDPAFHFDTDPDPAF